MSAREIVVDIPPPTTEVLSAPLTPSFDYTRSTGPILGAFFTGLRDGRLVGTRDSRGAVHLPPVEFDPYTRDALGDLVDIATTGTITSWTWVSHPLPVHPLHTPFAWALVRFDGADTSMLLPLDVPDRAPATGQRVRIRWAATRSGSIRDIECVEPEDAPSAGEHVPVPAEEDQAVTEVITPIALEVTHTATDSESHFLRAITEGRILGRRRSNGTEVYVPPRDYCPSDGVLAGDFVEVSDHGTVTTFAIVNVPFLGQKVTPPYVTAYILLDGADIPIQHLVLGCAASEVRMGMRVKAVWAPEGERSASMLAIEHFLPSGEPDADRASYAKHL